jgi:hypothetical protein
VNPPAVDDVLVMGKIERDIRRFACNENDASSQGMRVAYFIKYVRISSSYVGDKKVRFGDLVPNSIKHALLKDLLVDALAIGAGCLARGLDAKAVGVIERRVERHEHEYEGLRPGA